MALVYDLELKEVGGATVTVSDIATKSYDATSLKDNQDYEFRVKARDTSTLVESEWSEWFAFTTDVIAPVPVVLDFEPVQTGSIVSPLNMSVEVTVQGETWSVELTNVETQATTLYENIAVKTLDVSGLEPSKEHTFKVKAWIESNTISSGWSQPYGFTTDAVAPVPVVLDFVPIQTGSTVAPLALSVATGAVVLDFVPITTGSTVSAIALSIATPSEDVPAESWTVEVKNNTTQAVTTYSDLTAKSLELTGLDSNQSHSFRVQGHVDTYSSEWSEWSNFTTDVIVSVDPVVLDFAPVQTGSSVSALNLTATGVAPPVDAEAWNVEVRNVETQTVTTYSNLQVKSLELAGLTMGKDYEFRVQGRVGQYTSEWTTWYGFTTVVDAYDVTLEYTVNPDFSIDLYGTVGENTTSLVVTLDGVEIPTTIVGTNWTAERQYGSGATPADITGTLGIGDIDELKPVFGLLIENGYRLIL